MRRIPGGLFTMGSTDEIGLQNEHPEHQVAVAPFELEATEVTVDAYTACVRAGICSPAGTDDVHCNYGKSDRSSHPINCVDWTQATRYCTAQGKRLPSEEEWEFAARAGAEGRKYPWGDTEPDSQLCWSGISKRQGTCAVGSFARDPYGLADMAGGVWEWTASGYSPDYKATRVNDARIIRGGSWAADSASHLRNAYRAWGGPSDRDGYLGFRCAR
jgi:formylglycine-generating enzyme required for sulfatase activity